MVRAAVAQRIPEPRGEAELRLLRIATVQCDLNTAFALADNADAIEAAALRMLRLAREARPKRPIERSA